MTQDEIKKLGDKTLMFELFKQLNVKSLVDFAAKVNVPHNTMAKWKCDKGIPTELPDRGAYRQLFQALFFIEQGQEELNAYREHFKSLTTLQTKYHELPNK